MSRQSDDVPLLVINNAAFGIGRGGMLFVEPPTGRVLADLARSVPGLVAAQGAADFGDVATPNVYDLTTCEGLRVDAIPWKQGSRATRMLFYVRALPWILGLVWRSRALHVFMPGHLPLLFILAARLLGRPYSVYLRGELDEPWLGRALSGARFTLVANEAMRERSARHCPHTLLVAPMVELAVADIVSPGPRRTEAPWRLLFVGRIEPPKGISELLDAAARVQARGLAVELDLVGWAQEIDDYRREADRLGVAGVRFHGTVSDRARLRELYAQADLFVLPTHTEGFPRVLYEAMAFGVPALTTFVGGISAVMEDGVNCLRIPVRDAEGLAQEIERALADPALRARIAAGGTDTVRRILGADRPTHASRVAQELAGSDSASS
jgi:glycosyltransferase involved in cell wall biosynthesis